MRRVILDANLLFLLIIGCRNGDGIDVRRGTKEYAPQDYDRLVGMLLPFVRPWDIDRGLSALTPLLRDTPVPERRTVRHVRPNDETGQLVAYY